MNQDCDSWCSYFSGLFNLRGSDVEYNPVFFAYAVIGMNTIRCLYSLPQDAFFWGRAVLAKLFLYLSFQKHLCLSTLVSFLSSFVSSISYPLPLIRAREAAKSSAALLSTLAGLVGDLGHDGRVLCLSP